MRHEHAVLTDQQVTDFKATANARTRSAVRGSYERNYLQLSSQWLPRRAVPAQSRHVTSCWGYACAQAPSAAAVACA